MQEFLQLHRNVKLRFLMLFLTVMAGSSVGPLMTIYYTRFFGRFTAGILIIVVQIASLLISLYGGHVTDIWGRKKPIVFGWITITTGYLIALFANISPTQEHPVITWVGFLIISMGYSFADPAEESMIIDVSTEKNRKFIYSFNYWILNLAVIFGASIGGFFFDKYFVELLVGISIISIISLFIASVLLQETITDDIRNEHSNSSVISMVKNYLGVISDKRWVIYTVGMLAIGIMFGVPENYLPGKLEAEFHNVLVLGQEITPAKVVSYMLILNTIIIVLFMTAFNKWTKTWQLGRQFTIGILTFGTGIFFSILFNNFWLLIISSLIYTVGEMIEVPASQVIRVDMMNPKKLGAYSGFSQATRPLSGAIGGLLLAISNMTGDIVVGLLIIGIIFIGWWSVNYSRKMPKAWE